MKSSLLKNFQELTSNLVQLGDVLRKENQWTPQARNLGPVTNLSMMIAAWPLYDDDQDRLLPQMDETPSR